MPFQPITLPEANLVRALFQFGADDITNLMGFYNVTTLLYEGTEARYNDSKTRTVQVGAQTSFGMAVDLACYPLSALASFIIPIAP